LKSYEVGARVGGLTAELIAYSFVANHKASILKSSNGLISICGSQDCSLDNAANGCLFLSLEQESLWQRPLQPL
jgi:hypothetical protein